MSFIDSLQRRPSLACALSCAVLPCITGGCAGFPDSEPDTSVVLENRYPAGATDALTVYDAYWLNVSFAGNPVGPGGASSKQPAVPTSGTTAYVVLARGWDATSNAAPTSLVLLRSRFELGVGLGETLRITIDDESFVGNCAVGSHLTQDEADFLTQVVFASDFSGLRYNPATCTTTQQGGTGAP